MYLTSKNQLKDVYDAKKLAIFLKIAQKYLYLTSVRSYDEFINCLTLECLILSILNHQYEQLILSIQKIEKHREIDNF